MPSFWNREAQRFRHLSRGGGSRRAVGTQQDIQRRFTPISTGVAATKGSVFGGPKDVPLANQPFAHGTYKGQSALTEQGTNYGSFPASAYRTGAVQPQQWYPVTNPTTGQRTYIQALDVGPGTSGGEATRGVDLSPAAAQQIGYKGTGQLQVGGLGGSFSLGQNVVPYGAPAQPSVQAGIPSGGGVGSQTTLASVGDLYGGTAYDPVGLGLSGTGGSQGPASYSPYPFQQDPFGFDTSGSFGAADLPASPYGAGDIGGAVDTSGMVMPPMTEMPTVDPSSLLAQGGQISGTMSTDTAAPPDQTPSATIGAGDIGATYGGGQAYNYSPAPNGGTYVYDANWNYVSTIPGQDTSTTPAATTTSSTPTAPAATTADASYATPYATQTQSAAPATIGSGFYGGSTSFGSASTGLYGGLEGGLSTGSVGGFSGMMDSGLGGGMGPPNVMRYL